MNKEDKNIKEVNIEEITAGQALNTIYNATRQLTLNAETHDLMKKLKQIVEKNLIEPPKFRAEIVN